MATRSQKNPAAAAFAAVAALNSSRHQGVAEITNADATDLATAVALVNEIKAWFATFHRDVTATPLLSNDYTNPSQTNLQVTNADATDAATLLTLVNEIKDVTNVHVADDVAHKIADTTNTTTNADATDTATAVTLVNEMKGDWNGHFTESGVHSNDDGTNTVTNANATDQATAITLANEIKANANAHITSAPTGSAVSFV